MEAPASLTITSNVKILFDSLDDFYDYRKREARACYDEQCNLFRAVKKDERRAAKDKLEAMRLEFAKKEGKLS